jgi:hypothetical protein
MFVHLDKTCLVSRFQSPPKPGRLDLRIELSFPVSDCHSIRSRVLVGFAFCLEFPIKLGALAWTDDQKTIDSAPALVLYNDVDSRTAAQSLP